MKKFLVCLLALALCLTGCGSWSDVVPYDRMEYSRPDMAALQSSLEDAVALAQGTDCDAILDGVYRFYDAYDWFYTSYSLADIRYSGDLTDLYWSQEYDYCTQQSAQVDAALESLYYALAQSPCRDELERSFFGDGFFLGYDGESLYDEELIDLLGQEAQMQSRYYALTQQGLDYEYGTTEYYDACADDMAQLLAELIGLRQEIAASCGYRDYAQFATDLYYSRDYTVGQMEAYLQEIQEELVPLYRDLYDSDLWDAAYAPCSQRQTFRYVEQTAKALGGRVEEAFRLMDRAGLYDIAYGQNKYNSSFEVYLSSYYEPFLFLNPTLTAYDQLTMAHEFGHFCNDYASFGSYAGVDVAEFFSQGMEYLSLCYGDDALTQVKLADSLSVYAEQAAYASFELEMYRQESPSAESLYSLYETTLARFGIGSYDRRDLVDITHFYTNPLYIFSYIVSNDAAMQLYQMEQAVPGSGREVYEENLATEESYFLTFLDSAGLESPFAPGRVEAVRRTFEMVLK